MKSLLKFKELLQVSEFSINGQEAIDQAKNAVKQALSNKHING